MFTGLFKDARFGPLINVHSKPKAASIQCGASLNAQERTREKKVDMDENLSPKHCPNSYTCIIAIHVCRFGAGLKKASLKSYVSIGWDSRA